MSRKKPALCKTGLTNICARKKRNKRRQPEIGLQTERPLATDQIGDEQDACYMGTANESGKG